MEVNFFTSRAFEVLLRQSSARTSREPAAEIGGGATPLATNRSIVPARNQAQPTRPDKIARANELLSDPGYPSGQTLDQLARCLAQRL